MVLVQDDNFAPVMQCIPQPQIHFGPTKSLENVSSGRKCWTQFNFFTEHRRNRWIPLVEPRLKNNVLYNYKDAFCRF